MRSKNHRKQSAYWHGERLRIYLKRGALVISLTGLLFLSFFSIKFASKAFSVRDIKVSGNHYIGEDELKSKIGISKGENLFKVSLRDIEEKLKASAWIKGASLRKEFPGTLRVKVEETVPKAIVESKGNLYLIAPEGNLLEALGGDRTPFLPVITGIDFKKNKAGIEEALKLVDALNEKGIAGERNSIEIYAVRPYGLVVNIDDKIIRIGYNRYNEKLERWKEIEVELRKKGVMPENIDYIDLRFKNSVIVKPVKVVK
ncbi:MAG: FtsQ-type POTRA domain-containing protein [Nitrospirae bacterium]|nr:FtsQ-type POTRA domain-containing protein [Nitrospirota bacterium]